jgi:hypothetical protein
LRLFASLDPILLKLFDIEIEESISGDGKFEVESFFMICSNFKNFITRVVILTPVGSDEGWGENTQELILSHKEIMLKVHAWVEVFLWVFFVETDLSHPLGLICASDC